MGERRARVVKEAMSWLQSLADGTIGQELDSITHQGLQVNEARNGFLRCYFKVPPNAVDEEGRWHVGAMAALMDMVACGAVYSFAGHVTISVDFNISFYSTAQIHEEVEIEGRVVREREKITSVQVEVKRRSNGDLIALGREWMILTPLTYPQIMRTKL